MKNSEKVPFFRAPSSKGEAQYIDLWNQIRLWSQI